MAAEVDPPSGANVLTQFEYSFTDRLAIAERTELEPTQADAQFGLDRLVVDGGEPAREWLTAVLGLVPEDLEQGQV
jgi:hypothetical protein